MKEMVALVSDWGGFEELIAKLHETGTVKVERDVTLTGKSGATRQIDVLVTHTEGLYTHRILVECKYLTRNVERAHVDEMLKSMDELNASKGVIFTTKGYQSGAETQAKFDGVDIFVVREITDEEWGGPGRNIDFFIHIVSLAFGKMEFPGAMLPMIPGQKPPTVNLSVVAGENGFESSTPVTHKGKASTIEKILNGIAKLVMGRVNTWRVTFNGGTDCTVYLGHPTNLVFDPPLIMPIEGSPFPASLPGLTCEIAVRITQSRFKFDRGDRYLFALAVENCITGTVYAASRPKDGEFTSLQELAKPPANSEPLRNGSIMRVFTKAFFVPVSGSAYAAPSSTPTCRSMRR
jgi:hypothetical protein